LIDSLTCEPPAVDAADSSSDLNQNTSFEESNPAPAEATGLTQLCERVRKNDPAGMEELYKLLSGGIRFLIMRQLGADTADDRVHDTFLIIVDAIKRGLVREPERLMGFVRTVVHRQVASSIRQNIQARRERVDAEGMRHLADSRRTPEQVTIHRQKIEIMQRVLAGLTEKEREILRRFYLLEQPAQQICEEMGLSETQYRLLKSRAKAKFGERGRAKLGSVRDPISSLETVEVA
jgi:RNA polymerase sigma-70 factor (ECF subfamily)